MRWDVAGIGNALMDALVVARDADRVLGDLGLIRGTMHPVSDAEWQTVFEQVRHHGVAFESGGSCANTIATLGRLGARAIYRGQVGDDELGRIYAERMRDACGDHALCVSPTEATGKCLSIVSAEDAERTMCTDLGASVGLSDLGAFAEALREARVAHFTGYTLLGGPIKAVVEQAMPLAKAAGALISLDAADPFVVQAIRDDLWARLRDFVDVVFLNAEEARALTEQAPERAAETVAHEAGVRTVVVKLGARGSVVLHEGVRHEVPADLVAAVDTTGAGDAYAGGFLYGVARGWAPPRCGALGSAVAAATVSQVGAVVGDADRLRALARRLTP